MHTLSGNRRLANVRYISWLDLALSAVSLRWDEFGPRVVVQLMDIQGNQAWWCITLNDRWLRGNNGAVTVFDSLLAADRFLRLLKVNRFVIGGHVEHGPCIDEQDQEVFTVGERCKRCDRKSCGNVPKQEISQCSRLTQRRLAMRCDVLPVQDAMRSLRVPAVA